MMLHAKRLIKLLKDLTHVDASRRRNAAEALSGGDERAVYPLIRALSDENHGVQDAAMRSLISIGGESTAYMVLPLLRENSYLRNTAMIILKDIGTPAVSLLYPLFKDKDDDIRKFSIDLLTEIKGGVSPEKIFPLMSDRNANVRASATKAAGIFGCREAVPRLIEALRDEEWVCFSALEALAMIRDEASAGAIASLLDSPHDTIRYAAIEALGYIGSSGSVGLLMDHLTKADDFEKKATIKSLIQIGITPSMTEISGLLMEMFRNGDWEERLITLNGIVAMKESKAVREIMDIAGSLDPADPESEEKLYRIRDALRSFGCADIFLELLKDPSVKFRGKVIIIEVVGELKCPKAVPLLINLIEEDLRDVRRASITALAGMDDEEAKQALADAVNDYDSHVRKAAVTALGVIGDKISIDPILNLLRIEKYQDVLEEAVKTLLGLDASAFLSRLEEFDERVQKIAGWYRQGL